MIFCNNSVPTFWRGVAPVSSAATRSSGFGGTVIELDETKFASVRKDSIDYAVLEKAPNVSVVPCDIGWSDIGSWTAFADLLPRDEDGNHTSGEVALIDTTEHHHQR